MNHRYLTQTCKRSIVPSILYSLISGIGQLYHSPMRCNSCVNHFPSLSIYTFSLLFSLTTKFTTVLLGSFPSSLVLFRVAAAPAVAVHDQGLILSGGRRRIDAVQCGGHQGAHRYRTAGEEDGDAAHRRPAIHS